MRQRILLRFYSAIYHQKLTQQKLLTIVTRRHQALSNKTFSTGMSFWMSGRNPRPWRTEGAPEFKEDVEEYTPTTDLTTDVLLVKGIEDSRQTDAVDHHTSDFDQNKYFVVRRGQDFNLKVLTSRPFDPENDVVKLTFQFGVAPDPFVGTHISLEPGVSENGWIATLKSTADDSLEFAVNTNARTCAVGPWRVSVDTKLKHFPKTYRFTNAEPIRILFNPWCKDDTVYMGDDNGPFETELEEYVLNDIGCIYINKNCLNRKWRFGQFDDIVLETVEYLLQTEGRSWNPTKLSPRLRGNPIFVSRKLSAIINGNDDNGVIQGNWSGEYEGGTSPSVWKGSVKILEEYMKPRKENPTNDAVTVKYGQCWVFSGLTTTLCRVLGIPARSVTNFDSAHDKDETADINLFFDENGKMRGDSVWNFHVWNEVYFRRPDLSTKNKYDGWQVIDATPQEASEGLMQLGPAPLLAIKNGNVTKNYDSRFVFAEVNGDMYVWQREKKDEPYKFRYSEPNYVGKKISTKRVGKYEREDLTDFYKYPEGSKENNKAVEKAKSLSERNREWDKHKKIKAPPKDVKATLSLNQDIIIGEAVEVLVDFYNTSDEERALTDGIVHIATQFYTNQTHKVISDITIGEIKLQPNEKVQKTFTVPFNDYYPKLTDFNIIGVNLSCMVVQTGHHVTDFDKTTLQKPSLKIKAPAKIKLNQNFQVEIGFTNPLAMPLTNCLLTIEGTGMFSFKLSQSNLGPKADYRLSFEQVCRKIGKKSILVSFDSDELLAVENVHEILVEE